VAAALGAFVVVFVAEFGDRTQLLLFALAGRHRPLPVVLGLVVGYSLTNLVAVAVGAALGAALPERAVQVASGLVFLAFAVWTLRDDDDGDAAADERSAALGTARVAASVAGGIILSELGDKSMLATATLAADGPAAAVWLGATLGVLASGGLGVVLGRLLADRADPRLLRWGAALLFAGFGVAMLVRALPGCCAST
jgi:putative Ca2+/H+ antiporter (TMEM165/GDT1 family)